MGILLLGLRMGTKGCFYEEFRCCRIKIENPSHFPFVPNELNYMILSSGIFSISGLSELGSVDKCFTASLFYSYVRYWPIHVVFDFPYSCRYVVDAADRDNIPISKSELHDLLSKPSLSGIPLLVLGNKIDKPEALSKQGLTDQM